jgi:excisionase family DNA binding protein
MADDERTRWLTVQEVADQLREHPITIYRRISRGELAAVRIGRAANAPLRVDERALSALLQPTKGD